MSHTPSPGPEPSTPNSLFGGGGGAKAPSAASEPPRPPSVPPPAAPARQILNLPKISFRIVDDGRGALPGAKQGRRDGVFSETSRGYGYNDSSNFERPEHYIRHIEPIESELKNQVEYDMDEQDQEWLDDLNRDRKRENSDQVSYELFEIIVDRLEKEWFDLTKRIPDPKSSMPSEEAPCAVCDDGEGENSNAIVFCDGCNLAVHQDCYGVPYIPEGQWLCRKCTVSPENPVSCVLCPAEGGAFKQTSSGQWAHLLCAIWIPEVGVGNSVYMEPIDGIEAVPRGRWKLPCSICKQKGGACIQCDSKTCYTAFHVSCARENGMLGSMKALADPHGGGGSDGMLRGWCEKHVPDDVLNTYAQRHPTSHIAAQRANLKSHGGRKVAAVVIKKTKKSAKAYAKTYLPPPPLVPAVILDSIIEYVARMPGRKKRELVDKVGKYWSLKREARRGAPLLKRLHLEPWTSNGARIHTEEEKAKKFEYLTRVRNDLEKVRMLTELCGKREKEKHRQTRVLKEVLESFLYPHEAHLREALQAISSFDKTEVFVHPVSLDDVPDYLDVIKQPMDFVQIDLNIENHRYINVQEFQDDINLVFDNCRNFNPPEHPYHELAVKMQTFAEPILEALNHVRTNHPATEESLGALLLSAEQLAESNDVGGDLEGTTHQLAPLYELDDSMGDSMLGIDSLFAFRLEPTPTVSPAAAEEALPFKEEELAPDRELAAPVGEPAPPARPLDKRALKRLKNQENKEKGRLRRELIKAEKAAALAAGVVPSVEEAPASVAGSDVESASGSTRIKISRASLRRDSAPVDPVIPEVDAEQDGEPAASTEEDEDPALEASAVPSTKPESSRKRKRTVTPSHMDRDVALTVAEVNPSDTFKMFETGWILPEGSSRRGARPEPPARAQSPVKNKRQRTTSKDKQTAAQAIEEKKTAAPAKSTVKPAAVASTSAEPIEQESAVLTADALSGATLPRRRSQRGATPSGSMPARAASSSSELSDLSVSPARSERGEDEMDKTVIADGLPMEMGDEGHLAAFLAGTPAKPTRARRSSQAAQPEAGPSEPSSSRARGKGRETAAVVSTPSQQPVAPKTSERSSRRKSVVIEESKPADESANKSFDTGRSSRRRSSAASLPPSTPAPASGSRKGKERERVGRSEGAADVEMTEEGEQEIDQPRSTRKTAKAKGNPKAKGKAQVGTQSGTLVDDEYVHGTLVWAKAGSYPWFPAQVVDTNDIDEDQGDVRPSQEVLNFKHNETDVLVHFFDKSRSWAWSPRETGLQLLGEDAELDLHLSTGQRFKSSHKKKECKDAFNVAIQEIESSDEQPPDGVEDDAMET